MKGFSSQQLQTIGFSYILMNLEPANCYGETLKKAIDWVASTDRAYLSRQLDQLSECISICVSEPERVNDLVLILQRFKEIRGILRRLEGGIDYLDEVELFQLKNFFIDMEHLRDAYSGMELKQNPLQPIPLQDLIRALNPDVQTTRTFTIDSRYSVLLTEIRAAKKDIEDRIMAAPQEQRQLHLKRNSFVEQERQEELSILRILTKQILLKLSDIQTDIEFIANLDFLIAKSRLAIKFNGTLPQYIEGQNIDIQGAVNPYVQSLLDRSGKVFTPISLSLKEGANLLTGANMGGKTVALSTVTLNILLAHCGFYVFCQSLILPHLDFLFYLHRDAQSVEAGLSSFGAEVMELISLLENMKQKRGFCALDEFARDTNPEEGQMMVRALLRFAEAYPTFCLVSTHFSGAAQAGMHHFQVVGLKNANLARVSGVKAEHFYTFLQDLMDFSIEPVEWDSPPPQDALRVAELMGIQKEFLDLVMDENKESEV